ncbi:cytochrome P450 [Streptomyces sp. NPDC053499]|uniref:cytochrome P450 n=1 Tax=Streptomyces sp. NPDC053499 TaxID=3365707 RepID=UPI0037D16EBF
MDASTLTFPFGYRGDELPAVLRRLQAEEPVARVKAADGAPAWLVTSYELICTILRDTRFSLSRTADQLSAQRDPAGFPPVAVRSMRTLTECGLRDEVMRHMGPGQQTVPTSWMADRARQRAAEMARQPQPVDLLAHFARPFTLDVACRQLGVPREDGDFLAEQVEKDINFGARSTRQGEEVWAGFYTYLPKLLSPGREPVGLLGDIAKAARERQVLSEQTLVDLSAMFVISAVGNPMAVLTSATRLLLRHPAVAGRLRAEPELWSAGVDELLRHVITVGGGLARIATEDVQLGDASIEAGDLVLIATDVAGFDPAAYADPERLDLERPDAAGHLAFGGGRHYCPASQFNRTVLATALEALLTTLPDLRPAAPLDELEWLPDRHVLLPRALPVTC